MFVFYKSEYNPNNLTGEVGGGITSSALSGYLGELFYYISSPASSIDDVTHQYRKIFVRNEYTKTSYYTRVWIDAIEHSDQISIAIASGLDDTSSTPTGEPVGVTGWSSPTNFANGVSIGTITPNSYTGFWVRETLSGISSPDPYATFRLYVGGII